MQKYFLLTFLIICLIQPIKSHLPPAESEEFAPNEQSAVGQLATKEMKVAQSLTDEKVENNAIMKDSINGSGIAAPVSAEEMQKLRDQFAEMENRFNNLSARVKKLEDYIAQANGMDQFATNYFKPTLH